MAEEFGKGKRVVKPKLAKDFVYDKESLEFLSTRSSSGSTLRHNCQGSIVANVDKEKTVEHTLYNPWSEIEFLSSHIPSSSSSLNICVDSSNFVAEGSRSPGQHQSCSTDDSELCFEKDSKGFRNYSSTRLDYLDQYSLLSVSPTPRPDSLDMSDGKSKEPECECTKGVTCTVCTEGAGDADEDLGALLRNALKKIDYLTNKVEELDLAVKTLKISSSSSGSSDDALRGKSKSSKAKKSDSSSSSSLDKASKAKLKGKAKLSKKVSRVEEEKLRQLKLMKDKLP